MRRKSESFITDSHQWGLYFWMIIGKLYTFTCFKLWMMGKYFLIFASIVMGLTWWREPVEILTHLLKPTLLLRSTQSWFTVYVCILLLFACTLAMLLSKGSTVRKSV